MLSRKVVPPSSCFYAQLPTVLLICRTAKEFDAKNVSWLAIPRVWYFQCEDLRTSHTAMLPQHNNRKRLLEPVTQACAEEATPLKATVEISHKRHTQGMHGYDRTFVAIEDMFVGSSKNCATGSKYVDKESSAGHASQNPNPRRRVSKLEQVRNIVLLEV